jgi:hypothetical protein
MHNSSSDFSAILGLAVHLSSNSISIMSDFQAEMISTRSPNLWINEEELARLGGVESIARILRLNSHIKSLDLYACDIGVEGARVIAEMLKSNSALQVIYLHYNRLEDEGARAIAEALRVNSALKTMELGMTEL